MTDVITYAVPLGRGVVNISCGQMVEPGEQTHRVDPDDPHDKALIKDGRLVRVKGDTEVQVSPEAAELAEENNVDLSEVSGSGAGGNIVVADVQKAIDAAENEEEDDD